MYRINLSLPVKPSFLHENVRYKCIVCVGIFDQLCKPCHYSTITMNRSPDHEETFIYTYGFDYIVMVKAIFNGRVSE